MTVFPWLILLLLMVLLAELVIIGPRALRSIMRGEGVHVSPASAKVVLLLVVLQIALVLAWLFLFGSES